MCYTATVHLGAIKCFGFRFGDLSLYGPRVYFSAFFLYQNDSSRIFRTLIIHESFICLTHMRPKWLRVKEENKPSVSLSCKGSVLNIWD